MNKILPVITLSCLAPFTAQADISVKNDSIIVSKIYEQEKIGSFLASSDMQPMAQAAIVYFNQMTGKPFTSGDVYLLRNPETEEWGLFKTVGNDKFKYIAGGEYSDNYSSRQNSIAVSYTFSNGLCDNLGDQIRLGSDLLFSGVNTYSDKGDLVLIFGKRAFNQQMMNDSTHKAKIIRMNPNGHCTRDLSLDGLSFSTTKQKGTHHDHPVPNITSH